MRHVDPASWAKASRGLAVKPGRFECRVFASHSDDGTFWAGCSPTPHWSSLKQGTPSTHPILGDELRALRRLQREQELMSPFVFTSEPFTTAEFARMIERSPQALERRPKDSMRSSIARGARQEYPQNLPNGPMARVPRI